MFMASDADIPSASVQAQTEEPDHRPHPRQQEAEKQHQDEISHDDAAHGDVMTRERERSLSGAMFMRCDVDHRSTAAAMLRPQCQTTPR
jgi:hypothetical protein